MNKTKRLIEQIVIRQEEMKKKIKSVPSINWEILSYANTHTKDEVLQQYPEHEEFINSIVFNS